MVWPSNRTPDWKANNMTTPTFSAQPRTSARLPKPAPKAAPQADYSFEKIEDGTYIETYRKDKAVALLKDLPITAPSLRVKVVCDAYDNPSVEIYGFSSKRTFGPVLQRMVEENLRQHGQKLLGAPISDASIARIVNKFTALSPGHKQAKAATAWGRTGKAVIASLDLTDTSILKAVVTIKENFQINIKVTGIELPGVDPKTGSTAFFADHVAKEIKAVLPSSGILSNDEYLYYAQKQAALAGKLKDMKKPAVLSMFATAAHFSSEVTALSPLEKQDKAQDTSISKAVPAGKGKQSLGTEYHTPAYQESAANGGAIAQSSRRTSRSSDKNALFVAPPSDQPSRTSSGSKSQAAAFKLSLPKMPTAASKQSLSAADSNNMVKKAYVDITRKRTFSDAELMSDDDSSPKKHQPAAAGTPGTRKKFIAQKTSTASLKTVPAKDDLRLPSSTSSSSSDLPLPTPTTKVKKTKPIPTREEMHTSWHDGNMTQYNVTQLRGFLKQEDLMGGLPANARRDHLLLKIQELEESTKTYPTAPGGNSRMSRSSSPRKKSSPPRSKPPTADLPRGQQMDLDFVHEVEAYDRVVAAMGPQD